MESKSAESQAAAEIMAWLDEFALHVREENYEAASALFADDVVAFGTLADAMQGLDELMRQQWTRVWNNTSDFDFQHESLTFQIADGFAWLAVTWNSSKTDGDDVSRDRPGRATFVLRKVNERWKAIHSHLSLNPSYLRRELAGSLQEGSV